MPADPALTGRSRALDASRRFTAETQEAIGRPDSAVQGFRKPIWFPLALGTGTIRPEEEGRQISHSRTTSAIRHLILWMGPIGTPRKPPSE